MHGIVDQPSVTVEDVGDDGVVVAAVHGDLDVDTFRDVRQALFSCLNGQTSALVVDLGDVGFFGSMGIAVLVEARQRADVLGAGFAVVAGRRTVARPIRMTDMEDLLRLHRTQDEALATVRNGVEPRGWDDPDHREPAHHGLDHHGPDHHRPDHHGTDGVGHRTANGVGHHAPDPFDRPEDRSDDGFSWWSS
ncbi:STAS domain-containing protein [Actinosynnema sp. NPDC059335]|uniref:STAS domain-containing protein n=1 Tax=Actinosynnema sp. NPDC059335 TaxID=3346804 RepID=UPI0036734E24